MTSNSSVLKLYELNISNKYIILSIISWLFADQYWLKLQHVSLKLVEDEYIPKTHFKVIKV